MTGILPEEQAMECLIYPQECVEMIFAIIILCAVSVLRGVDAVANQVLFTCIWSGFAKVQKIR